MKFTKIWYGQYKNKIYEDIIRSIQEFEDGDISEQYDCLYDYFLDHEDIISKFSTFDFSNKRFFDKSTLDRVAKGLYTTKRLPFTISCFHERGRQLPL